MNISLVAISGFLLILDQSELRSILKGQENVPSAVCVGQGLS